MTEPPRPAAVSLAAAYYSARLDELLALCDRLEASLTNADETRAICSNRF